GRKASESSLRLLRVLLRMASESAAFMEILGFSLSARCRPSGNNSKAHSIPCVDRQSFRAQDVFFHLVCESAWQIFRKAEVAREHELREARPQNLDQLFKINT